MNMSVVFVVLFRYSLPVLIFLAPSHESSPKKYFITSAIELEKLQLKPGDTVMLKEGIWKDQKIVLKARGTEKTPVVMMAAVPGKVKLTGSSTLSIEGQWLVVNGLYFAGG